MHDQSDSAQQTYTDPLTTWLTRLRLGDPITQGPLALVPVFADGAPNSLKYRTLADAIARGEVTVTELPTAQVPNLGLTNTGSLPVLIIDGDEVVGGNQNRVVNTSLLVPAKSTFDLPVTCVEQGRWQGVWPAFDAGEVVPTGLRGQKIEQVARSYAAMRRPVANQAAVWDEVALGLHKVGSHSRTGAMRDAYIKRQEDLAQAEERFRSPADGAVGTVALFGGRAACADVFDQPGTLGAYYPRLVRSYMLEALSASAASPALDSAQELLRGPLKAERTPFRSPGLGEDVRIRGNGVVGAALVCDRVVVHTALFRHWRDGTEGPGIRRLSHRSPHYPWDF